MKSIVWQFVPWLARVVSACGRHPVPVRTKSFMRLQRGAVLRVEPASRRARLTVASGMVWLTGTPADGDILLRTGEEYWLNDGGPYVVEALATVEMTLQTAG